MTFPGFLAIPLYLGRLLRIDTHEFVMYGPYLIHSLFLMIGDYFFLKLCLKTIGEEATGNAMTLYLFNHTFGQQMHRLFSTSYEAILALVSLNYFVEMTDKFDKNLIMVILL